MRKLIVVLCFLAAGCLDNVLSPSTVNNNANGGTSGASPSPIPSTCDAGLVRISGRNFIPVGSSSRYTADLVPALTQSCIAQKTYSWTAVGACSTPATVSGNPNQADIGAVGSSGTCDISVLVGPDQKSATATVPVQ